MKDQFFNRFGLAGWISFALMATSATVAAAPLDVYTGPEITAALKADQRACLNVGDAVSCSAGMLNVLTGRDATNQSDASQLSKWGFVLASPQGALKDRIVVGTGGNAATDNGDTDPTPGAVEDGFKTNNAGDNFAATGKTGTTAGNLANPDNNNLPSAYDQLGTWDVGIGWLIDALTIDSVRRELMIGFDYNQAQNATGSVDYWALITVLDYDANGNIQGEINFEIKNDYSGFGSFTSTKTFNDQPNGNEFSTVNTKTCYLKDGGGNIIDVRPITGGTCANHGFVGYEYVNNASGDNSTEILAFLPELNANLENYQKLGYDAISVRMLFGCFNNDTTAHDKAGKGYLSGGATINCDGGGNVDVYLLANVPNDVPPPPLPEPGTLALMGLGLAGLGWRLRRRSVI